MPIWKNASAVFFGGTEQIRKLHGRRVRAKATLQALNVHDPASTRAQTFDVRSGMVGFIARPHPTTFNFLVAFPQNQTALPSSLDGLSRQGAFKVVEINEPTFKQQFEIEVA